MARWVDRVNKKLSNRSKCGQTHKAPLLLKTAAPDAKFTHKAYLPCGHPGKIPRCARGRSAKCST
eukprot:7348064-Heterocapsa_arctica.AAC.1